MRCHPVRFNVHQSRPAIPEVSNSHHSCFAGFFSQFGNVTNVRVSRNKKTGKAKHYAFLEYQYPEVAATAAEAMHDYMLFTQKLVVRVVPVKVGAVLGAYAHHHHSLYIALLASGCTVVDRVLGP